MYQGQFSPWLRYLPVGFLDHQPVSAAGGGEVGVDAAGAGGLVAVADETEKIFVIKCIIWIIGGKWKLISTNDQQFVVHTDNFYYLQRWFIIKGLDYHWF